MFKTNKPVGDLKIVFRYNFKRRHIIVMIRSRFGHVKFNKIISVPLASGQVRMSSSRSSMMMTIHQSSGLTARVEENFRSNHFHHEYHNYITVSNYTQTHFTIIECIRLQLVSRHSLFGLINCKTINAVICSH